MAKLVAEKPRNILVIQGDWNAELMHMKRRGTVGRFGVGETGERGERLLELAHKLTIVNTLSLFLQCLTKYNLAFV